jgi:membrane-bound metal-dependent hydrolase YbcI (DUF457 family)
MIQCALHLAAAALLCFLWGDPALPQGSTPPPIFVAALLLALAPDLDTPKSLVGSLLKPISVPLERRFGHRTITHSLLALGLVAGVAYVLVPPWWPLLAGAYASHLALDLLIGRQGIMLLWPSGEFLTLTAWRDDGPAPRVLLLTLLPAAVLVALWPQLGPLVTPSITAAAAVANPISTPTPTKAPTPQPTERPSITLSFALPDGVGLSALKVHAGDVIAEGQVLAQWEQQCRGAPACASITLPTMPALPPTPLALPSAVRDQSAARGVAEAQAALDALTTAQAAERVAMVAEQQREFAEAQRGLADLQRMLGDLQPRHERAQQEAQHAVAQAHQALLDAQDHMRTEQGIERAQAEADLSKAQANLDALPEQQRQALAKLDAEQQAAQILASSRLASARGAADDARQAQAREAQRAATSATAIAQESHATTTAVMQAHQALLDAQTARQIASRQIPAATPDPAAIQRSAERVHEAEAKLRSALDVQDHMRTEQGIERQAAEAELAQAQAELDALPDRQRQALAKLDAEQQAAQILATSRLASARGAAEDARRTAEFETQRAATSATAIAQEIQATATALMQAHHAAITATAQAWPTPAPNRIASHVSGRILRISAEEKEGHLVVTLELTAHEE